MKNVKKKLVAGVVLCATFVTGAFAGGTAISATLRPDIKVVIDGSQQSFADANGKAVYPISYNNTTYLPIRSIGTIMGKTVVWDEATQKITLSNTTSSGSTSSSATITLTAGNYVAGKDFPAGTYTVRAVKGSGNVWSSNMYSGGLNEIMASTDNEYYDEILYTAEFKNCKLPSGTEFGIKGDLTIELIPV